jgi:hypothetical protein
MVTITNFILVVLLIVCICNLFIRVSGRKTRKDSIMNKSKYTLHRKGNYLDIYLCKVCDWQIMERHGSVRAREGHKCADWAIRLNGGKV